MYYSWSLVDSIDGVEYATFEEAEKNLVSSGGAGIVSYEK